MGHSTNPDTDEASYDIVLRGITPRGTYLKYH